MIQSIADAAYHSGILFSLALFAAAAYCCLDGYRVYRVVLAAVAFYFGFTKTAGLIAFLNLGERFQAEHLLMVELGVGILAALLAWRVFLAGVFFVGYQLGAHNLPQLFDGVYRPIVSILGAGILGFLCVKATHMAVIAVTAVVGGFTMVNAFVEILSWVAEPYQLAIPAANSAIWLAVKAVLSIIGASVQIKRAPKKKKNSE